MVKSIGLSRLFLILCLVALAVTACERSGPIIRFGGGAEGGTIQRFAEAIVQVISLGPAAYRFEVVSSGGANVNLARLDEGKLEMAIVYAGELVSHEKNVTAHPENIMALARVYGPAAQLVVMDDSPVRTPFELVNQKVAIGPPGSASAVCAERYFGSLGLWEKIIPLHIGPSQAMKELSSYEIGAVWQVIGFPGEAFWAASRKMSIRLLSLLEAAEKKGFFQNYPFYSPAHIPAGTYEGQKVEVATFRDSAIWVATRNVDEDVVYSALKVLFSESGLSQMHSLHLVAWDLDVNKAFDEVGIPFHPGAIKYWKERFSPIGQ